MHIKINLKKLLTRHFASHMLTLVFIMLSIDGAYAKCKKIELILKGEVIGPMKAAVKDAHIYLFFNEQKNAYLIGDKPYCSTDNNGRFDCRIIFDTLVLGSQKIWEYQGNKIVGEDCSATPNKAEILIQADTYLLQRYKIEKIDYKQSNVLKIGTLILSSIWDQCYGPAFE